MVLRRKQELDEDPEVLAAREAALRADRVTGLPTRQDLRPVLQQAIKAGAEQGHRTALLFIDIGHLRDVNDSYGPDAGDDLLRQLAQRVQAELGGSQQLLRWAGAELALVAPGVETLDTCRGLAEGVFEILAAPFTVAGHSITITTSIGTALSDAGYASPQDWIDDAHSAMCEARDQGNRAVVTRDEATRGRVDIRISEDRLHNAVDRDELRVVYQEIIAASSGATVGVEAHLVWQDTGAGLKLIEADKFMPLLEKTGRIFDVAPVVLATATAQVAAWNSQRPSPLFLEVNLGPRMLGHRTFAGTVAQTLDSTGLAPELLILDVVSDALVHDRMVAIQTIRDLKYLGVRLALDEFGAGAATIAALREIVVDLVRIDPLFVAGLGPSPEDEIICRHLVGMARDLNLEVIATDVDRPEQAQTLATLGANYFQGLHFGKPDLAEEVARRL